MAALIPLSSAIRHTVNKYTIESIVGRHKVIALMERNKGSTNPNDASDATTTNIVTGSTSVLGVSLGLHSWLGSYPHDETTHRAPSTPPVHKAPKHVARDLNRLLCSPW